MSLLSSVSFFASFVRFFLTLKGYFCSVTRGSLMSCFSILLYTLSSLFVPDIYFFACPLFLSVFCCVISPHCVNTAISFTSVKTSVSTPVFSLAFLLPVPRTFCFLIWVFCLLANKVFLCQYLDASTSCVLVLFSDTRDKYHYWWASFRTWWEQAALISSVWILQSLNLAHSVLL